MATSDNTTDHRRGSWIGVVSLSVIHLLAFGALYLTVVQLFWAAQDHYASIGLQTTTEFNRLATVSNVVAGFTPLVVVLIFAEVVFMARTARKGKRWASAYSHAVVFAIGFAMFVSTAWIVHPMAWGIPAAGNAVATEATPSTILLTSKR